MNNLKITPNSPRLDMSVESERRLAEFGGVIVAAQKEPKDKAFDFLLRTTSDATLTCLLEGVSSTQEEDENDGSGTLCVLAAVFLRSHLHGDKKGGFSATDDEMVDIVNTLNPYWVVELTRRRQCFNVFHIPYSPWAFNAVVRLAEPNRPNIERTVAELKALDLPCPPPLVDEEILGMMESQGIGVELPMPVQGTGVASEEMLNVQPHKLPPVDPEKFVKAFTEINQAAFSPGQMPDLDMPDVDMFKKNGKVQRISGKDSPQVRVVRVINEHFKPDFDQCQSATARFFAFTALLRTDALNKWLRKSSELYEMPVQVLVAVATVKLTKGGSFPPVRFIQEVERLMKE